jgi:hypothetical protein
MAGWGRFIKGRFIKDKSAYAFGGAKLYAIARNYGGKRKNFVGQYFWARGDDVSTVGSDFGLTAMRSPTSINLLCFSIRKIDLVLSNYRSFSTDESAIKVIYLAIVNISRRWMMPIGTRNLL